METESRKHKNVKLSTGARVCGGQVGAQLWSLREYGLHAVHEGRSIQPGARERGGSTRPAEVRFGNRLPLTCGYPLEAYAAIAKRISLVAPFCNCTSRHNIGAISGRDSVSR